MTATTKLRDKPRRRDKAKGATLKRPRGRRVGRQAASRIDGREAILVAATRMFAEQGFNGTTTAAIAAASGVTQPLIHHHFATKEQLWREAIDRIFGPLHQLAPHALDELHDLSPTLRLKVLLRQFTRVSAQAPEIARVIIAEGASRSTRLDYLIEKHILPTLTNVLPVVQKTQTTPGVKSLEPALLLFIAFGAASHLFTVPAFAEQLLGIDTASPEVIERYANLLVEVTFHGVLTAPKAKR